MAEIVLAGDIGGTKTHLGLYRAADGALAPLRDQIYATRDYPNLEAAAAHFLGDRGDVAAGALVVKALGSADPDVKRAAIMASVEIGGVADW